MGKSLVLLKITLVVVLMVALSGTASAMSAYSRKYKMQCDACHSTIPKLNEFGEAFMAKGFVLPSQEGKSTQNEMPDAKTGTTGGGDADKAPGKTDVKAPVKSPDGAGGEAKDGEKAAAAKEGVGSGEEGKESVKSQPAVEPPPTIVYKLQSRDGSVYFTDNPYRKDHMLQKQEQGAEAPDSPSIKRDISPRKAVQPERPKSLHLSAGKDRTPAREKPERYRNYEECMERQLVDTPQPGSAQEMMDLFMASEKKCAPYQAGKR